MYVCVCVFDVCVCELISFMDRVPFQNAAVEMSSSPDTMLGAILFDGLSLSNIHTQSLCITHPPSNTHTHTHVYKHPHPYTDTRIHPHTHTHRR